MRLFTILFHPSWHKSPLIIQMICNEFLICISFFLFFSLFVHIVYKLNRSLSRHAHIWIRVYHEYYWIHRSVNDGHKFHEIHCIFVWYNVCLLWWICHSSRFDSEVWTQNTNKQKTSKFLIISRFTSLWNIFHRANCHFFSSIVRLQRNKFESEYIWKTSSVLCK